MKLTDYLDARGETGLAFARRAGLAQATISRILSGSSPTLTTARMIVEATEGKVRYEDLIGQDEGEPTPDGGEAAA